MIKKVYEADPLLRRRCARSLKIVSLIDAPTIIERILRHLKLWDRPERAPPAPALTTLRYDVDIRAWEDDVGTFDGTAAVSEPYRAAETENFGQDFPTLTDTSIIKAAYAGMAQRGFWEYSRLPQSGLHCLI